jgi:hypothetical protein
MFDSKKDEKKSPYLDDGVPSTRADWERFRKGESRATIRRPRDGWVCMEAQERQWQKRRLDYLQTIQDRAKNEA